MEDFDFAASEELGWRREGHVYCSLASLSFGVDGIVVEREREGREEPCKAPVIGCRVSRTTSTGCTNRERCLPFTSNCAITQTPRSHSLETLRWPAFFIAHQNKNRRKESSGLLRVRSPAKASTARASSATATAARNKSTQVESVPKAKTVLASFSSFVEGSRLMLSSGSTAVLSDLDVGPTSAVSVVCTYGRVSGHGGGETGESQDEEGGCETHFKKSYEREEGECVSEASKVRSGRKQLLCAYLCEWM